MTKQQLFKKITNLNEMEFVTGIDASAERAPLRAKLAKLIAKEQAQDLDPLGDFILDEWNSKSKADQIEYYRVAFDFSVKGFAAYFTSIADEESA